MFFIDDLLPKFSERPMLSADQNPAKSILGLFIIEVTIFVADFGYLFEGVPP